MAAVTRLGIFFKALNMGYPSFNALHQLNPSSRRIKGDYPNETVTLANGPLSN
jgi:hypothetical protein